MSRFHCTKTDGTPVAYGLDNVCGWFYQEFDPADLYREEPVVDEDTLFTGLSTSDLVEKLMVTDAPEEHTVAITLDLDPKFREVPGYENLDEEGTYFI